MRLKGIADRDRSRPALTHLIAFTLVFIFSACDRGGTTSRSGPSNQTVDSEFRVHRDKDGSVVGQPGISPYEGVTTQPTSTPRSNNR